MSTDTIQTQYLTFRLFQEEYGLGILRVKEIIEYHSPTYVPLMPPWIRGIINLRGSVVPVIDIAIKLGLPERPITKKSCIVMVEVNIEDEPMSVGLLVDSVSEVLELADQDIVAAPSFGNSIRADYLSGMGKVWSRFILLLDIERVLSAHELLAVTSAAENDSSLSPAILTSPGSEPGTTTAGG
jgi:purine-binding chemotaxis protein CheW